jgi:uncharacterized protein (DUF983 family)
MSYARDISGQPTEVWTNGGDAFESGRRPLLPAMLRGFRHRCPACGGKTLYRSYLKVSDRCVDCGEELSHHRADDAPPYFTIMIAGHVVVPLLMTVELVYAPPIWLHLIIWLPLITILCLALLPRVKGTIVGLQWAHRMHGFGDELDELSPSASHKAAAPASGLLQ